MIRSASLPIVALVLVLLTQMPSVLADDYKVKQGHKSFLCAVGCFWCGEQAFEQYAPGVTEAVSGYAGGTNDNPTYRNHPGHFEVVLVEYDPTKTSYELLVNYAWRNLDPFDGIGQFCDKGTSYRPAIFYANEEEKEVADRVRDEVLATNNWTLDEIAVPNLQRPTFWTAEDYHQVRFVRCSTGPHLPDTKTSHLVRIFLPASGLLLEEPQQLRILQGAMWAYSPPQGSLGRRRIQMLP